jgi:succinate dehydrogenase / fumarate reductase cytochrome b subunit
MKMNIAFLKSSIGKKVVMSLTGLFLCLFLVEHLLGNLLLFANDGGKMYEEYSKFLVSNPLIRAIEIVLFASLIGHAINGVVLWWKNRRARPEKYTVYHLDENTELASRMTMISGSVIFFFLVVHLGSFFWPLRITGSELGAYELVRQKFSNPWFSALYVAALVLIGYHLRHGFQSAFQTLGLRSTKYDGVLQFFAFIFWFLVPFGFATIPVYFYFFRRVVETAVTTGVH